MLLDTIQCIEGIGRVCVALRPVNKENCAAYVPLRDLVSLVEQGFINECEENEARYGVYLLSWSVKEGKRRFDDWSYRGLIGEKKLRELGIDIIN